METVSTWRTLVQSAMVLAALISSGASKAQAPDANSPAVEKSLKGFLRTLDDNKATLYIAAFRDLNGDGMPEAVVYLMGKSWKRRLQYPHPGAKRQLLENRDQHQNHAASYSNLNEEITWVVQPRRLGAGRGHSAGL